MVAPFVAPRVLRAGCGETNLLDRARRYVSQCPPAVSGDRGHDATFRVACVLVHGFSLTPGDALVLLREWNVGCQPPWSESELVHKVSSALASVPLKGSGYLAGPHGTWQAENSRLGAGVLARLASGPVIPRIKQRRLDFVPEAAKRVADLVPGVDGEFVKARSPVCPETQTPASFLQRVYRPGERVLVFDVYESQGHVWECDEPPCDARGLDHLINGCKDGVWFLSNPVDGEYHPNPRLGGKMSRRSEESVTTWRYLVLESDETEARDWLGILAQLPLRIAAIYTSGGRSIHALVRVDAASKVDWDVKARRLKPMMTVLGADPGSITAVRLTRLPGCYRGQDGHRGPRLPFVNRRWVDEALEFDEAGNPIWTPSAPGRETASGLWAGGCLQELLYLNPEPDITPICSRPTRNEVYQNWLTRIRQELEVAR